MITKLAKRWLERKGHHVVMRGSVEMVISGMHTASLNEDGSCLVHSPINKTRLVLLNGAYATLSAVQGQFDMAQRPWRSLLQSGPCT